MMTFGEKLKKARLASGLPVLEIAQRLGVTREAVYQYEMNVSTPALVSILRLERILGVRGGELIRVSKHAGLALEVASVMNQKSEVEHATN